tara:strand:+ start:247 stop:357 length:111 start_codon:yes stop_codon:yes gene_type:complete
MNKIKQELPVLEARLEKKLAGKEFKKSEKNTVKGVR